MLKSIGILRNHMECCRQEWIACAKDHQDVPHAGPAETSSHCCSPEKFPFPVSLFPYGLTAMCELQDCWTVTEIDLL